jgi:hypothetical protein
LVETQLTGTGLLTAGVHVTLDENATTPPVHFPCGAPHLQGLQVRVSVKPVLITVLVV